MEKSSMKKILYVEDDGLIAKLYSEKLAASGFEVVVAQDGLAAVQRLREFTPDLIVLDLLMPKLTGVDVLKFIRQQPALKHTRIIVFSNSFLSNLIEQVAAIGVEEALVKASVTPTQLVNFVHKTLDNPAQVLSAEELAAHLYGPAAAASITLTAKPPAAAPEPAPQRSAPVPAPVPAAPISPPTDSDARLRKEFAGQSPAIVNSVRQICREFLEAGDSPMEPRKLADLRRKIGFVSQTLGLAGRHRLAQLCNALEALLFELEDRPATLTDSIRHTIAATVALLGERLGHNPPADVDGHAPMKILVVDDDAVSSRAVVLALGRAKLAATSVTDPFDGLKQLQQNAWHLVLLDVNMPGLDGLALCDQIRSLPLHQKTPVIFVTSQADFKTRARSVLSGGNDLIAKPILPTELCVKVLSHLVKNG